VRDENDDKLAPITWETDGGDLLLVTSGDGTGSARDIDGR
jgi:hypothetical protein